MHSISRGPVGCCVWLVLCVAVVAFLMIFTLEVGSWIFYTSFREGDSRVICEKRTNMCVKTRIQSKPIRERARLSTRVMPPTSSDRDKLKLLRARCSSFVTDGEKWSYYLNWVTYLFQFSVRNNFKGDLVHFNSLGIKKQEQECNKIDKFSCRSFPEYWKSFVAIKKFYLRSRICESSNLYVVLFDLDVSWK